MEYHSDNCTCVYCKPKVTYASEEIVYQNPRTIQQEVNFNDKSKELYEIATKLAKTLAEKNNQYGSAFDKTAEVLKIILNGKPVEEKHYKSLLVLTRIIDKICRIGNDLSGESNNTEDSYTDIAGYGIIGKSLTQNKEKNNA